MDRACAGMSPAWKKECEKPYGKMRGGLAGVLGHSLLVTGPCLQASHRAGFFSVPPWKVNSDHNL